MTNQPAISVIVPVYKVEPYLHCCLDSILAQTFTDFELLLIDDGSPDQSGAICDEYAIKDSRIRVFHKENGGASSARNLGLDNARGEWVTFVDADDIIDSHFLEGLIEITNENVDLDFIQAGCCNYIGGEIIAVEQQYELYVGNDPAYLFNNFRGLTVSKLFRLENINKWSHGLPLRFDEEMRIAEDMAFTLDYILNVKHYAFIPEIGYCYRRDNMGSLTKKRRAPNFEMEYHSFEHLYYSTIQYMDKYNLPKEVCSIRLMQRGNQLRGVIESLSYSELRYRERISWLHSISELGISWILAYGTGSRMKRIVDVLLIGHHYRLAYWTIELIAMLKLIKSKVV